MLHGEKSQKRCAHALVRDVAGCYRQDATNRSRTPVVIHSISRVESLSMYHAQHKKGSTLSIFCTDSHERNSKNTKTRHYGTWQSTYENIGVEQWMRFIRPFLRRSANLDVALQLLGMRTQELYKGKGPPLVVKSYRDINLFSDFGKMLEIRETIK